MRQLARPQPTMVALWAALASGLVATTARADPPPPEDVLDQRTLRGFGTALNFRGSGNEFDSDVTYATEPNGPPVWAARLSARALVLPTFNEASASWGFWFGLRAGGYRFQKPAGSDDTTPGGVTPANLEPMIGFVAESVADEVRFEADVAPALSLAESSQLSSQAAIIAAVSTSPHDDLLFVPNLQGGGRLRVALSRRFRWNRFMSLWIGSELEAGYAKAASAIGTDQGTTGGGRLEARLYVRTPHWPIEGFIAEGFGDVGYSAVWAANVVVPLLGGGGVGVEVCRNVEARWLVSVFSPNPVSEGISLATSLGVRWTFGDATPGWTERQIDVEPELVDESQGMKPIPAAPGE